jgi:hypothetical protein
MSATASPILVTGAHRTGTTWVGRMLAAAPGIAYISEPLNVRHRPGVFRAPVKRWYTYINPENESEYLPAFHELIDFSYHLWDEIRSIRSGKDVLRMFRDFGVFYLGSMHGERVLLKDPFAIFSLPWFADRLRCQIVVTVRHPAAFASSLKRLNWSFDFGDLLQQPMLMRDCLGPYRREMESVADGDIIGQASLLWVIIYQVVRLAQQSNPSIRTVVHEDLSRDPLTGFRTLYDELGLDFTQSARRAIVGSTGSHNPAEIPQGKMHSVQVDSRANLENWKRRLSSAEIARVRGRTEELARFYYPEVSWN